MEFTPTYYYCRWQHRNYFIEKKSHKDDVMRMRCQMVEKNLSNHFLRRVLHNRRKKYLSRQVFLCECKKITIAIVWKKTIHKHKPKTCKNSLRQHFFKSYNTLKTRRKMRFGERSSLNVFYSWEYLCGVESCIKIRLFNFNIVIKK